MNLVRLDGQRKDELSMVEVASEILAETNQAHYFNDLVKEIQDYLGLSDEEMQEHLADLYTEINTDGSFISLGENRWGLRAWYAIDAIDEEIVETIDDDDLKAKHKARRSKTDLFDDDDMIDYNDDDPEDHEDYDDDYYDDDDDDEEEDDTEEKIKYTVDSDDDDDEESNELEDYRDDLEELGDDAEAEGAIDGGLEGDLTVINPDDDDEEDEDDLDDEDE